MQELGPKLHKIRKTKKMTQTNLAKLAGCSVTYISMLENSKVEPSISQLQKITKALGITIVDLFRGSSTQEVVVREHERIVWDFTEAKIHNELLMPTIPSEKQIDARLCILHPSGGSGGDLYHPGEEFGLVLQGSLELTVNEKTYMLGEGDSFYFLSTSKHRFRNTGEEDAVILWINHPPTW